MPCLANNTVDFKKVLTENNDKKNLFLVIGPEGDFSPEEIKKAKNSGFVLIGLGKSVLRSETAAIVCAGFIKLFFKR